MATEPDDLQARRAADELLDLYERSGGSAYFGEPVTQLEHALQAADLARAATSDEEVILAALLHDVGHLLEGGNRHEAAGVIDHDTTGARYLSSLGFSERVAALVGGHVDAKRYLVATNPEYRERLSPASTLTLQLQGGPMTETQAGEFAAGPYLQDRLRLRSWDEQAKAPGRPTPPLSAYREMIVRHLSSRRG